MSDYTTSIGLDVHARSIKGCAFNPCTGEVAFRSFPYDPSAVAAWVLSFESPKAVYESGVTGFHLCRELRALGVDCAVGAVSKFLLRHGHCYPNRSPEGRPLKAWTRAHWEWVKSIRMPEAADADVLEYYIDRVERAAEEKAALEGKVKELALQGRWKPTVDALRCMKGVEVVTAMALACEVDGFSRFGSASRFASWLGLVPSESSSGERRCRGGITKAGNGHLRRLLVEAAWHYVSASRDMKPLRRGQEVAPAVRRHAAKGSRRLVDRRKALDEAGKRAVVANCAVARELACWCWALGRMVEAA